MSYLDNAIERQRTCGWTVEALILGAAVLRELKREAEALQGQLYPPASHFEYLGLPIIGSTGSPSRVELVCRHGAAGAHIFTVRL